MQQHNQESHQLTISMVATTPVLGTLMLISAQAGVGIHQRHSYGRSKTAPI